MKKRILSLILAFVSCISLVMGGCASSENTTTKIEKKLDSKYVIAEQSKIEDDFEFFGMEMNTTIKDLALADVCSLFPGDNDRYIYLNMPEDTDRHVYRAKSINVNNKEYLMRPVEINGCYQKYIIESLPLSKDGEYEISKINFMDEREKEDYSFNLSQLLVSKIEEDSFVFRQEHRYSVVLSGQNFESIYQFNKENNAFVDFWAKLIRDTEALDMDQRSFFYFAFNCYDPVKKIYFTPEDILQLDVNYTHNTYAYKGTDKKEAEKPPLIAHKPGKQEIKPETIRVTAADEKRSNKKLYEYETINKLCDADLTKNVEDSNAAVLQQIAREYDWAVAFGAERGYPYKKIKAGWFIRPEYDVEFHEIEDFKTINVKYRYEGKSFDVKTASLINPKSVAVKEDVVKPTRQDKMKYDLTKIIDSDKPWLIKVGQLLIVLVKLILPVVIFIIIVLLLLFCMKKKVFRKKVYQEAFEELKKDMTDLKDDLEEKFQEFTERDEDDD